MSTHLFIYGTLLPEVPGPELTQFTDKARHLGSGHVAGTLYDLGDFPGAALEENSGRRIVGEVFELLEGEAVLDLIDDYEGFVSSRGGSLFTRASAEVKLADGRTLQCWIYTYDRDPFDAPVIGSGDWRSLQSS